MYARIHVAVDNSDHSNAAVDLAVVLGKSFGAGLVASHTYAAKLHDVRFKQMEFTLPDEYKDETELEKQRKIHDSLIARGLQLISDSYLDQCAAKAQDAGVPLDRKMFDGRTFEPLVDDLNSEPCDLLVMGALGQGAVKDSTVGSMVERVLRRTAVDTLVVRDPEVRDLGAGGAIAVAIDGSAHARGALAAGCALARATGKHVEIVACQDPDRPEEALLSAHLEAARRYARSQGVGASATLLDGRTFSSLGAYAERTRPWLLVVGRQGIDAGEGSDVGSTTEHLTRTSPCNVLVVSGRGATAVRTADIEAEAAPLAR